MAQGAVIAAALTDHSAHPYSLQLDGLDVLKQPGAPGNLMGTPLESIHVDERGPGGVSSMTFAIDDPGKAVQIVGGARVLFLKATRSMPLFRGRVDHWSSRPAFGQGRIIDVTATGIESTLDDVKIAPAFTPSANANTDLAIQAAITTAAPQDVFAVTGSADDGNATQGIGELTQNLDGSNALPSLKSQPAIQATIREAIRLIAQASTYVSVLGKVVPVPLLATVDFNGMVRVWPDVDGRAPSDYAAMNVTDTTAGTYRAEDLHWDTEPGDLVHEVYIAGGNAAGSGWFGDGSGIRGKQDIVTDTTSTTAALAAAIAAAYFAAQIVSVRGSFDLTDYTPESESIYCGSLLNLTDAETGATGQYRIFAIDKTWTAASRENWHVTFGGFPRSAASLVRRLTRSTLS